MTRPPRRAFVACLVLALSLPTLGAAAAGVHTVTSYWNATPQHLPQVDLASPTTIMASDGRTPLASLYMYNREPVSFEEISAHVTNALVATEDVRFYTHDGVDLAGIARALVAQVRGSHQGGSSITQQYVKLTVQAAGLSWEDEELAANATATSVWRKLREAHMALNVEELTSKEDILAGYLNLAYFGAGAYGIQAAAQRYFSTDAANLTLPQAALLVGVVNNPSRLDPTSNPEGALTRRDLVLRRMQTAGYITAEEYAKATKSKLKLKETFPAGGCTTGPAPLFCDWAREQLEAAPALGATPEERRWRLLQGGLTITTTLDLPAQEQLTTALRNHVPATHDFAATGVLVTPGTGAVRAMASTKSYGTGKNQSVVPWATREAFQPGSTFKTFTLAAALERGWTLTDTLPGGSTHTSRVFKNPPRGYFTNSADGIGRNLTLANATAQSVNTAYVQLAEDVGNDAIADAAIRAGVTSLKDASIGPDEGAFTLGTRETSPLQIANAYATFAAHGVACQPNALTSIRTDDGTELLTSPNTCTQAFDPAVADTVTAALHAVPTRKGSGSRASVAGTDVAGKTGTTQNFGAAWFAGYSSADAAAIWVGHPKGPSHALVNTLGEGRVYGGTVPADIFADLFEGLDSTTEELAGENRSYLAR